MSDGPGWMTMVGISIPMWQDKLSSGVREAEAMASMARSDLKAMTRMVEGEAAIARHRVHAARTRFLSLRDDVVPRTRRAIDPVVGAYAAGNLPLVSVLEAAQTLWSAEAELVSAEVELGLAWARLRRAKSSNWARTRVLEQLGRVRQLLPPDVSPVLGPDASGVGWVFQYAIEDTSGTLDLARLRELQDFTIRPALQAVHGVAEIASFGGFERQYQIVLDPNRLAAYGLSLGDVTRAVRDANSEVGARVLELAGREYVLRGRGYVTELADLEASVVSVGAGGSPVRLRDVARVQFGPDIRRGAADLNARGEAVGGIVVMRIGSNALEVNDAVKREIARPCPMA